MELLIDTAERETIKLALLDGKKIVASWQKHTHEISEHLLEEINKLLKATKLKPSDFKRILVNPGPGGFASTRTGVATANALAYALGVPVAEWPSGKIKKIIEPKYDKAPNITKPRKLSS